MQRVPSPAGSIQTVCVVLIAAACGSAGGGLDQSLRPAATAVPTPGRTANGQPILPPAAPRPAAPASTTPLPATAVESLSPADVIFDAPTDAGPDPAPEARPAPSTPSPAANPSPPPAEGGEDEDDEEEDDD
jgi:hypothetical protein